MHSVCHVRWPREFEPVLCSDARESRQLNRGPKTRNREIGLTFWTIEVTDSAESETEYSTKRLFLSRKNLTYILGPAPRVRPIAKICGFLQGRLDLRLGRPVCGGGCARPDED